MEVCRGPSKGKNINEVYNLKPILEEAKLELQLIVINMRDKIQSHMEGQRRKESGISSATAKICNLSMCRYECLLAEVVEESKMIFGLAVRAKPTLYNNSEIRRWHILKGAGREIFSEAYMLILIAYHAYAEFGERCPKARAFLGRWTSPFPFKISACGCKEFRVHDGRHRSRILTSLPLGKLSCFTMEEACEKRQDDDRRREDRQHDGIRCHPLNESSKPVKISLTNIVRNTEKKRGLVIAAADKREQRGYILDKGNYQYECYRNMDHPDKGGDPAMFRLVMGERKTLPHCVMTSVGGTDSNDSSMYRCQGMRRKLGKIASRCIR